MGVDPLACSVLIDETMIGHAKDVMLGLRRNRDGQQSRKDGLRQPFGQACIKESVRLRKWRWVSLQAAMGKVFPCGLGNSIDLDHEVRMLNPEQRMRGSRPDEAKNLPPRQ